MRPTFLALDELSPYCRRFYNNCLNVSALDFNNPVGCWKQWIDDCTVEPYNIPTALVIIIIIISVLSFVSNSIVCAVFCVYDQLRLVKHYFVINLAVADTIIVTISIPLFIAHLFQGVPSSPLCRGQILLDVVCGTASILSLAVISLERYIAVEHPLLYNTYVTPARAVAAIIFTWVYSIVMSFVTLFSFLSPSSRENYVPCLFFGGEFVIFITASSFVLPVAIMIAAYLRIFKTARHHARRIAAMHVPQNQLQVGEGEAQTHVKLKRELKGAQTLTIIMGTHILCWCPLFVYLLVASFCPSCYGPASIIINYIILVLRYCNTLANPIIYSGFNRQFRAAIKQFVLRRRGNEGLAATVYT